MASSRLSLCLFLLTTSLPGLLAQSTSVADNAFDSLDGLGCSQFKAIILEAGRMERYKSSVSLTLFVFNDTAYNMMKPTSVNNLYDKTSDNTGADEYVSTFTTSQIIETSSFSAAAPQKTFSVRNRKLFLNSKRLRAGDVASGQPGPTKYFANGGIVIRPNIQAGKHVIHILDRVLPMPMEDNALAYASGYNPDNLKYQFFLEFMDKLSAMPVDSYINSYDEQVHKVLVDLEHPCTFFLPSDKAVMNIPTAHRSSLLSNQNLLLKIITLHIVPKQVIYTSLVNHNEQFNTQYNSGRVTFRTNFDREAVYVSGSLSGDSMNTVTARINQANVTVLNGVVHHIDEVLGFVYKTVLEEIEFDPVTGNFETLISRSSSTLKTYITANTGVYVFAPTNEAMQAIVYRYENYINNQSLVSMMLEYAILQPDQRVSLTDHSGGYESFTTARSRYNNQLIKIYSQGNDTWVEGGYVRARVIKPDIGCTNGIVHQIDAVFGVPTRDLPYSIFCDDKLQATFIQMQFVGLDNYMRDPTLLRNQACTTSGDTYSGAVPNDGTYGADFTSTSSNSYDVWQDFCGHSVHRCEFTFFVPNGTAIDNFARTSYGRNIMNDIRRWRWILRRLLTFREVLYLDRLAPGQQRVMYSDNGEEIVIRTDSRSNIPSAQRDTYVMFEGVRAQVIHSDLGATNGVMHIIDNILFVPDDLTRDISAAEGLVGLSLSSLLCLALLNILWVAGHR